MMRTESCKGAAIFAAFFLLHAAAAAQAPPLSAAPPPAGPPSPQQLDDLVAPIALYPDPVLGEVLAASTYPIEIAEAQQWMSDHHWKAAKLMKEARKQNWDPSVQGLVAFPNVVAMLAGNINWTTQLGNAFLANQADVMQAVQRMRAQAEARGTLHSTPHETVTTQNDNGQPAIAIQPSDPDIWWVPDYNPVYVWGPPTWGAYPPLPYPGIDIGLGWWPGIDLGLYFGGWGGWGWGGWGWAPNWYAGNVYIDNSFFNRYGFRNYYGGGRLGTSVWEHNPEHRLGVPYADRQIENRYARNGGLAGGFRGGIRGGERSPYLDRNGIAPQGRFGNPGFEQRGWTGNRSVFGGYHNGGITRMQSDRGFSSIGGGRAFGGFGGGRGGFGGAARGGFGGGGARGGGGRR